MRSNGWNDEAPVRKGRGRGGWIKWLLVGAVVAVGLPVLIGTGLAGMAMKHRSGAWPAALQVHARFQTDEGARDLYRKNPVLANAYPTEAAFLDTVRGWRGKVGALPVQEPREGRDYDLSMDPEGAEIRVKGLGGAWMQVEVHGGPVAAPGEGEGLVRLFFGEDEKALDTARAEAREGRDAHDREVFKLLFVQCTDDAGTAALYRAEPDLRATYPSEAAFLAHVKAMRPVLVPLVTQEIDKDKFRHEIRESPFGRTKVLRLELEDRRELSATWRDGKLGRLDLQGPGSRR